MKSAWKPSGPSSAAVRNARNFPTVVKEFLQALGDRHTYSPWRNPYIIFGFLWGMPVPFFSAGIDVLVSGRVLSLNHFFAAFARHPAHFIFVLHPLLFAIVFGAMGTIRHKKETQKEILAGMIVHDLRNPLSATIGFLQLIQTQSQKLDGRTNHCLQRAYSSCQQLLEMTHKLLDIMRMEERKMPMKLEKQDLIPLVQAKVEQYKGAAEVRGLRIQAQVPSQPVEMAIDGMLLGRVVENLVVNAIQHASNGGEITLGLESPSPERKSVLLWVKDTGEGIPPEHHHRLFQKYGQVEMKKSGCHYGTGLGLAFCRLAVEHHRGRIYVKSEAGKGSTFTIELPEREQDDGPKIRNFPDQTGRSVGGILRATPRIMSYGKI